MSRPAWVAALAVLLLSACATPTPDLPPPTPTPVEPIAPTALPTASPTPRPAASFLLVLTAPVGVEHRDPGTGLIMDADARAMALGSLSAALQAIDAYPDLPLTLSLSPSLLRQLREMLDGDTPARDVFWELSARPATELTADDKRFIIQHFFDGRSLERIARDARVFPRWAELRRLREQALAGGRGEAGPSLSMADWRDLQVLYNLSLFSPRALQSPLLAGLVARGRNFTEDDKQVLFEQTRQALVGTAAALRRLSTAGKVSLAVLPLVEATAAVWRGDAAYPYPADADRLLTAAASEYSTWFGRRPDAVVVAADLSAAQASGRLRAGVAGAVLSVPNTTGRVSEFATDAALAALAAGLGADASLALPVTLGAEGDLEAEASLLDTLFRLPARAQGRYRLIDVRDGGLTTAPLTRTVAAPVAEAALPAATAMFSEVLRTRAFLEDYLAGRRIAGIDTVRAAQDALLAATDAGLYRVRPDMTAVEQQARVRDHLGQVFALLGVPTPDYIDAPLAAPTRAANLRAMRGPITPTLEGDPDGAAWAQAARVTPALASLTQAADVFQALSVGVGGRTLYVRLELRQPWEALGEADGVPTRLGVYLQRGPAGPGGAPVSTFMTRIGGDGERKLPLGITATHLLEWTPADGALGAFVSNGEGGWTPLALPNARVGLSERVIEMAVPLDALGFTSDDALAAMAVLRRGASEVNRLPEQAVLALTLPDIGTPRQLGRIEDPAGDDRGPGSYVYPTDALFVPGSFDLRAVTVQRDANDLVFAIELGAAIRNPWGSPIGLSLQTIDLYLDRDPGRGTGARALFPGRNAALPAGYGWDAAVRVDGWEQALYFPGANGAPVVRPVRPRVVVDPRGRVTVRVPLAALPEGNPAEWAIGLVVLSQEVYPSEGVWNVRDVDLVAGPWRFGGGPDDLNHTRIIDVLLPAGVTPAQSALLGGYRPVRDPRARVTVDDLPVVPMVTIGLASTPATGKP